MPCVLPDSRRSRGLRKVGGQRMQNRTLPRRARPFGQAASIKCVIDLAEIAARIELEADSAAPLVASAPDEPAVRHEGARLPAELVPLAVQRLAPDHRGEGTP